MPELRNNNGLQLNSFKQMLLSSAPNIQKRNIPARARLSSAAFFLFPRVASFYASQVCQLDRTEILYLQSIKPKIL
jgi:hypothetical protein